MDDLTHIFGNKITNRYFTDIVDSCLPAYCHRQSRPCGAESHGKDCVTENLLTEMMIDGKTGLVANPTSISIADIVIAYFEKGKDYFQSNLAKEKQKYSWESMMDGLVSTFQQIKQS